MTGTVIGLVALFSNLNAESRSMIGPSLALAMTATFYGLLLANALLLPLADRLHVRHLRAAELNEHIYHILMLIQKEEPLGVIEGEIHAQSDR